MQTGTPFKRYYDYYATSVFCKRTWYRPKPARSLVGRMTIRCTVHGNPAERHQGQVGAWAQLPCRPPFTAWPPWMAGLSGLPTSRLTASLD